MNVPAVIVRESERDHGDHRTPGAELSYGFEEDRQPEVATAVLRRQTEPIQDEQVARHVGDTLPKPSIRSKQLDVGVELHFGVEDEERRCLREKTPSSVDAADGPALLVVLDGDNAAFVADHVAVRFTAASIRPEAIHELHRPFDPQVRILYDHGFLPEAARSLGRARKRTAAHQSLARGRGRLTLPIRASS